MFILEVIVLKQIAEITSSEVKIGCAVIAQSLDFKNRALLQKLMELNPSCLPKPRN
jgi:hypothetical protein